MSSTKKKKPDLVTDEEKYSLETRLIYGKSITDKWDYSHHVTAPISSSTTFRLDSVERGAQGFMQFANTELLGDNAPILIYDRLGEPNKDILEENLAHVEKGETAVSFSSGMAAISAVLGCLTSFGDEIIRHSTLYGCTISLFNNWYPKYKISTPSVDLTNIQNFYNTVTEKTRVVYLETPANPNLEIIDLQELVAAVKLVNEKRDEKSRIYTVVDNTFATPFCQRPLEFGVDFVVHSLTKGIGGFGTDMGGVVIGKKKWRDILLLYRKDFGAVLNTKSAWAILTYGLPTLPIRQKLQIQSSLKIAEFLEQHPKVEFVNYPGLKSFKFYEIAKKQMLDFEGNFAPGSLLYFVLKGDSPAQSKEKGGKFMDYIANTAYTMTLAVSLGHTRTLIEHPASMTHSIIPPEKLTEHAIDAGGIRLALGLENVNDIISDLEEALKII